MNWHFWITDYGKAATFGIGAVTTRLVGFFTPEAWDKGATFVLVGFCSVAIVFLWKALSDERKAHNETLKTHNETLKAELKTQAESREKLSEKMAENTGAMEKLADVIEKKLEGKD